MLAAPYGLDVLERLGLERVRGHNAALAACGQRVVAEALHAAGLCADASPGSAQAADSSRSRSPQTASSCSQARTGHPDVPMRVVRLAAGLGGTKAQADALCEEVLDRLGCQIKIDPGGLLRLSAHIYNRTDDYDRLATVLAI